MTERLSPLSASEPGIPEQLSRVGLSRVSHLIAARCRLGLQSHLKTRLGLEDLLPGAPHTCWQMMLGVGGTSQFLPFGLPTSYLGVSECGSWLWPEMVKEKPQELL